MSTLWNYWTHFGRTAKSPQQLQGCITEKCVMPHCTEWLGLISRLTRLVLSVGLVPPLVCADLELILNLGLKEFVSLSEGTQEPQTEKRSKLAGILIAVFLCIFLVVGAAVAFYYREQLMRKWRAYMQKAPETNRYWSLQLSDCGCCTFSERSAPQSHWSYTRLSFWQLLLLFILCSSLIFKLKDHC